MSHRTFVKKLTIPMLLEQAKDILSIGKELDASSPNKGYWVVNADALLLYKALAALRAFSKGKIKLTNAEFDSLFERGIGIKSLKHRKRLTNSIRRLTRKNLGGFNA